MFGADTNTFVALQLAMVKVTGLLDCLKPGAAVQVDRDTLTPGDTRAHWIDVALTPACANAPLRVV